MRAQFFSATCRRTAAAIVTGALLQLLLPVTAHAAWTAGGVPVCATARIEQSVYAVTDGDGGVFVGWTDQRADTGDVYLQHLDAAGALAAGWPANGLAVCAATGLQALRGLVVDGSGGVFLAWDDARADADLDVYAHHVLADGSLANGWPADGRAVAAAPWKQHSPQLAADGAGGVVLGWLDGRECQSCNPEVYALRLDGSGAAAPGWAGTGTRVSTGPEWVSAAAPVPDGSGGVYLAWHALLPRFVVRGQHLAADGSPASGWPAGGATLAQSAGADDGVIGLLSGPAGGAILLWTHFDQDNWGCECADVHDYRARAFGPDTATAAGWPVAGVLLGEAPSHQAPVFSADESQGAFFAHWKYLDYPNSDDAELRVSHVTGAGLLVTSAGAPDGRLLARAAHGAIELSPLAGDGAGGAYLGWSEGTGAQVAPGVWGHAPHLKHVLAAGALDPLWPSGGTVLSDSARHDHAPALAPDGSGGVFAAWRRHSGSATADVVVAHVTPDGAVPVLVSLVESEARPGFASVTWAVSGGPGTQWRVERSEDGASWRELAVLLPDGVGRVAYEDASVAPGARYGYRLSPLEGGAPRGETWIEVPRAPTEFALRGVWPNPARNGARVRFALEDRGAATLTLLDPQGRVRRAWEVRGEPGERELSLGTLAGLSPGVYWLRLAQGARVATARVAVIR